MVGQWGGPFRRTTLVEVDGPKTVHRRDLKGRPIAVHCNDSDPCGQRENFGTTKPDAASRVAPMSLDICTNQQNSMSTKTSDSLQDARLELRRLMLNPACATR